MNIFAVDYDPYVAASMLPDKLVVKMPTETTQMIAHIFSEHYLNLGTIPKKDGTPYKIKSSILKHPCTKWAVSDFKNLLWLFHHGIGLCFEYESRYFKTHAALKALDYAYVRYTSYLNEFKKYDNFDKYVDYSNNLRDLQFNHWIQTNYYSHATAPILKFVRAMKNEEDLLNSKLSDIEVYREYVKRKWYFNEGFKKDINALALW